MEIPRYLILVCSVVLIQAWLPVAFSRPEMSEIQDDDDFALYTDDESESLHRRSGLPPGYYSQQCNVHKPCPKGKYCYMFMCVACKRENQPCTAKGQCCRGVCSYGRCKRSVRAGGPGTFCQSLKDCNDKRDSCCVREPAISPHINICRPRLGENQVCGPHNQFKFLWLGCGPCKKGLTCRRVGIFGVHEICTK